jgi:hypothetical protein
MELTEPKDYLGKEKLSRERGGTKFGTEKKKVADDLRMDQW